MAERSLDWRGQPGKLGSGDRWGMAQMVVRSLERMDWSAVARDLDLRGYGVLPDLLDGDDCARLIALYGADARYRKTIVMQNHAYGRGEYRYFARPLPELVESLRAAAYPHLAPIANRWAGQLGLTERYPESHAAFLEACHAAGQARPTPLLLKYGPEDFNRLHQDTYGAVSFPLQMAVLLSKPGADFEGGEFLLSEQRPRTQSKAEVVPLCQGDAVIFAGGLRPGQGAPSKSGQPRHHRLTHRHGVSRVRSGQRYCLGIIFHDAA